VNEIVVKLDFRFHSHSRWRCSLSNNVVVACCFFLADQHDEAATAEANHFSIMPPLFEIAFLSLPAVAGKLQIVANVEDISSQKRNFIFASHEIYKKWIERKRVLKRAYHSLI